MSSEDETTGLKSSLYTEIFLFVWNLVFLIISNWMIRITVQFIHSKPPGRKLVGKKIQRESSYSFSQATSDVQMIGLGVLSLVISILPTATMVKLLVGDLNYYLTFLIIEAWKISFIIGKLLTVDFVLTYSLWSRAGTDKRYWLPSVCFHL